MRVAGVQQAFVITLKASRRGATSFRDDLKASCRGATSFRDDLKASCRGAGSFREIRMTEAMIF